jgi:hypothetical protein
LESNPYIDCNFPDFGEMTIQWDLKSIVLWEQGIFLIPAGVFQSGLIFFIVNIANTFKKEQREDIGFKVGCINRSTKNICSLPEMRFELGERY